jgi:hypothetical protein
MGIIYLNVSVYRFVKVWVVGKECSLDDGVNEMAVVRDNKRSFSRWCFQRSFIFLLCMEKLYRVVELFEIVKPYERRRISC